MIGAIKKITKWFFILMVMTLIALIINAIYQKQQFELNNAPTWQASQSSGRTLLDVEKGYALESQNNDLVFINSTEAKAQRLYSNYKERFPDLKMHLKDLDQNGKNEMVFLVVDDDYSSAIHIYFNLNESKLGQHKGDVIVWTGESLHFDSADNLYVSSCGSQYCNDTYFKWSNGKLVEEYTDTYESM